MRNYLLAILIIFGLFTFLGVGLASAHGLAAVAEVTAEDLGVSKPTLLPTSPFYFVKEFGWNFRLFFTFNPVRKIELQLKYTDEKAAEMKEVAERSPEKTDALEKALENYTKATDRLKAQLESLKETSQNPNVDRLLDNLADRALKHTALFEELKDRSPGLKDIEAVDLHKDDIGESLLKVSDKVEDVGKIAKRVRKIIEKEEAPNTFERIRKLEFIDRLERAAEQKSKEALREVRNDLLEEAKTFVENELKTLDADEFLSELEEVAGDDESRVRIIGEIKLRVSKDVEGELSEIEEKLEKLVKEDRHIADRAKEQITHAEKLVVELEARLSEAPGGEPDSSPAGGRTHPAANLLARAKDHLGRAKTAFDKGAYGEAFGQAQSAEVLARDGLRFLAREHVGEGEVKEDFSELEAKIQKYTEAVRNRTFFSEKDKAEAERLLGEAKKHLGFARDAFAKSDLQGAAVHIGHVQDWLHQLVALLFGTASGILKTEPRPIACPSVFIPECQENRSSDACHLRIKELAAKYPHCGFEKLLQSYECGPQPLSPIPAGCKGWVCYDGGWKLECPTGVPPTTGICPRDYNPVCGIDGKTYPNACTAKVANVAIKYAGACETSGVPPTTVKPEPVVCIQIYAPVCGSDGKTYSNECFAHAAGVVVKYKGECGTIIKGVCPTLAPPPEGCKYDSLTCSVDGRWSYKLICPEPTPLPPTTVVPPTSAGYYEFKFEADDLGFYPSGVIYVTKGSKVKITFAVRTSQVYYGGLDFRSPKFKTNSVKPGEVTSVDFVADEPFTVTSYWPLTETPKAYLKVELK